MALEIRSESAADQPLIWKLNRAAFETDAEANLVDALRDGGHVEVSLVAADEGEIVGHILFSVVRIMTPRSPIAALSLAPMAVAPTRQRQGIGSKLVQAGLAACRQRGDRIVVVLGHPEFYPRFGFSARLAQPLESPFGGGDAWMALELVPDALAGISGPVHYPPPLTALQ